MRRSILSELLLFSVSCGLLLCACFSLPKTGRSVSAATNREAQTPPVTCADALAYTGSGPAPRPTGIDLSCATIPYTIMGNPVNQTNADLYSWLTFVSLSWPASGCAPNQKISILQHPDQPTWLTYLTDDAVFTKSGPPAAWCGGPVLGQGTAARMQGEAARVQGQVLQLPLSVRALAREHPEARLILSHNAEAHGVITSLHRLGLTGSSELQDILQATKEPLVDQNGRFVRYSVSMNQDEYKYIVQNALYTAVGQKGKKIIFPVGSPASAGAIELKAGWKVLGAGDDPTHFFTQTAIIYNTETGLPSPGPNPVQVGLVALHILHKAKGQTVWAWSTFEQNENDTKSFYNPGCSPQNCPPNTSTAAQPYTELDKNGKPLNQPTQVVAYIQPTSPDMNAALQSMLSGTVWSHYRLVSTQWSNGAVGVIPQQLGNSVAETFVPLGRFYSCVQCHSEATAVPGGQASDLSFILNAQQ